MEVAPSPFSLPDLGSDFFCNSCPALGHWIGETVMRLVF